MDPKNDLPANFRGDPSKIEKKMFRTPEGYVYDRKNYEKGVTGVGTTLLKPQHPDMSFPPFRAPLSV